MIDLVHGEPIRFGADGQRGVRDGPDGRLRIVEVADVGEDAILVHDADRDDPTPGLRPRPAVGRRPLADAVRRVPLGRPARSTPRRSAAARRGVVREKGPGDLATLLRSNGTWAVN